MNDSVQTASTRAWRSWLLDRVAELRQREEQVFLVLALVIGALTGMAVVAFILLTERMGMRLYPVGGAPWRRVLFPVAGSLSIGYLLYKYFPNARGSGVPQTKAALFAREGRITLRTVLGKFFCTSATLASGIPLGREGPSVQASLEVEIAHDLFERKHHWRIERGCNGRRRSHWDQILYLFGQRRCSRTTIADETVRRERRWTSAGETPAREQVRSTR